MIGRRSERSQRSALVGRTLPLPTMALLGSTIVAAAGAAAATVVASGTAMFEVVIGTAVAYVVTSVSRRLRAPAPAPLAWGLFAVVAVVIWELLPSTTWWGLPTVATARAFADGLRAGVATVTSAGAPWTASQVLPVVLLAGSLTGVCAASTWVARRRRERASLLALSPGVALYSVAVAVGRLQDTIGWTLVLVAFSVVFLATADGALGWPPSRRTQHLNAYGVSLSLLVLATVAVGVFLPGSPPLAASVTAEPATVRVGARSLLENVPQMETRLAGDVMFVAKTPLPTYWQVATLTRFRSTQWSADSTVLALAAGKASSVPASSAGGGHAGTGGTLTAHISLRSYTGALLPAPPATTRVVGNHVVLQDGLVVAAGNGTVFHYEAIAAGASLPGTGLPTVGAKDPVGAVTRDIIPPAVPARVADLARRLVAGVGNDPLAKADALVEWFTSGRFHYSLTPSVSPRAPVRTFLFATRTGSCVQFASAFAVLARLDGLPTRLAVGFTPGTPIGTDRYVIYGSDAHVWPQVYLGRQLGWVGFEPTPSGGRPSAEEASSVPSRGSSVASTTHATYPTDKTTIGHQPKDPTMDATNWALAVAALAVLVVVVVLVWRRRRWRRRAVGKPLAPSSKDVELVGEPDGAVLSEWRRTEATLGLVGLGRMPSEGLREHGERVQRAASANTASIRCDDDGRSSIADAYAELLTLVGRSCYSVAGCEPADAARASALAEVVTGSLRCEGRSRFRRQEPRGA